MKRKILFPILLSFVIAPFGFSAKTNLPQSTIGELKTEWLEKIYQENRPFETIDIGYDILNTDGNLLGRFRILLDAEKKRIKMTEISADENPLQQFVFHFFAKDDKKTDVRFFEKRTPKFHESFTDVKQGRVRISRGVNENVYKGYFFNFDEEYEGRHLCRRLKLMQPSELCEKLKEVQYKGKECLKFSGPITMIFEKERGVLLEKIRYYEPYNERPAYIDRVQYCDHKNIDGVWFPTTVHCSTEGHPRSSGKTTYKINSADVKFNHKIPDEEFIPRIPLGFKITDEINRASYLATGFTKEEEKAIQKRLDEIFEESKRPK